MNHLHTEGDVNFSPERKRWQAELPESTRHLLQQDEQLFLHQSLSTPCLNVIDRAEGVYLIDHFGKKYFDFHGNNVHQLGYGNEFILARLKEQLDLLSFSPRRYTNTTAISFAQRLTALCPGNLKRVLFAPGGTSAISMALKLARVVTRKPNVVSLIDSFHGASLDAIAAGGEEQFKLYMGDDVRQSINIPGPQKYRNEQSTDLHYADALDECLQQNPTVGAFLIETIRNTDVQIPSKAYWKRIREVCTKHNVLLILDEIPIAFGRTGKMFAFEHYDIEPDILCLGKGLGAGVVPFAAIVAREEYNIASDVSLGHFTHEKSPLGCAAGLALLDYLEDHRIIDHTQACEKIFCEKLAALQANHSCVGDVRGIGMLWGVELVKDRHTKERASALAEKVMYECLRRGLSLKVSQGNVLQLSPPLIITPEELTHALTILEDSINEVSK